MAEWPQEEHGVAAGVGEVGEIGGRGNLGVEDVPRQTARLKAAERCLQQSGGHIDEVEPTSAPGQELVIVPDADVRHGAAGWDEALQVALGHLALDGTVLLEPRDLVLVRDVVVGLTDRTWTIVQAAIHATPRRTT